VELSFKDIYLAKRHPALSEAEFPERWRQHSAQSATTKNIRQYFTQVVQCCRIYSAGFPADGTKDFDAVNLMGLRDFKAALDYPREPEIAEIMAPDELRTFSRPIRECIMTTRVRTVKEGALCRVPVIRFLRRAADIDPDAFEAHWTEVHAGLELDGEGGELVQRSVHNRVILPPPRGFEFDMVSELWFESFEAARVYFCDAKRARRTARDRAKWCDVDSTVTFIAQVTHARPPIA
jgi:hypothetical protein